MSEQTPTADLTAILAEHEDFGLYSDHGGDTHYVCACDQTKRPGTHREHVAEQITAAGFGPVRAVEAERDALRERITALADELDVPYTGLRSWLSRRLRALLDASPDREGGAS